MEINAKARFIRMSPRKVRLVIDVVRGLGVDEALTQLQFMKKAAAHPVMKLINSAIANAENNFQLKRDDLFVKSIAADGGPVYHRWRPRAMGRAAPIRKRTTHISVVLDEKSKKKEKVSFASAKGGPASGGKATDKSGDNEKIKQTVKASV